MHIQKLKNLFKGAAMVGLMLLVVLSVASFGTVRAQNQGKTVICHIPPGNPSNAQTITVGVSAVSAHLNHGDTLDACPPIGEI